MKPTSKQNKAWSRAPKLLGDFGEGLATYTFIRKGFEVACVDHVGADLIAQRDTIRLAVSVKTRRYRTGSVETRGLVITEEHLDKLEHFASRFGLEPTIAHVVCVEDEKTIHLFLVRVEDVRLKLDKVKGGFRLRFNPKKLQQTISLPYVDYSCWRNEEIGSKLYPESSSISADS